MTNSYSFSEHYLYIVHSRRQESCRAWGGGGGGQTVCDQLIKTRLIMHVRRWGNKGRWKIKILETPTVEYLTVNMWQFFFNILLMFNMEKA